MLDLMTVVFICTGMASTTPLTEIQLEVRHSETYSTIRYEIAEGSLQGTAYVQSMGRLSRSLKNSQFTAKSGDGPNSTKLEILLEEGRIAGSHFKHYVSGFDGAIDCVFQGDDEPAD